MDDVVKVLNWSWDCHYIIGVENSAYSNKIWYLNIAKITYYSLGCHDILQLWYNFKNLDVENSNIVVDCNLKLFGYDACR
jgi:hypothetical protein